MELSEMIKKKQEAKLAKLFKEIENTTESSVEYYYYTATDIEYLRGLGYDVEFKQGEVYEYITISGW